MVWKGVGRKEKKKKKVVRVGVGVLGWCGWWGVKGGVLNSYKLIASAMDSG